jgi:hypothetical protein
MFSLAVLAAAAAAVSWDAQYVMVRQVKHTRTIAALEAAIPDVGALIFATLGIALALHGKRAIRARTLNVACVAVSLAMNALAAAPGWRDLAIWVMPSAVYALASDTLIGVIRAWVIATTLGWNPGRTHPPGLRSSSAARPTTSPMPTSAMTHRQIGGQYGPPEPPAGASYPPAGLGKLAAPARSWNAPGTSPAPNCAHTPAGT